VTTALPASETLGRVSGPFYCGNALEIHKMGCLGFGGSFVAEADVLNLLIRAKLLETSHGSFNHREVIVRTERFGKNVLDADGFQHCAAAATGDDTGSVRSRTQQHLATIGFTQHVVRDGIAAQIDFYQVFLGLFRALADALRHFLGLAVANAYLTLLVTHHNQCGETEAATALHNFGTAVDVHDFLDEFRCFFGMFRRGE